MTAVLPLASPTQFAWSCIGSPPWPPPDDARGTHPFCWLCGGPTDGVGWLRDLALSDKFTNHNLARHQPSDTLCQACVYLGTKEGWEHYRRMTGRDDLGTGHAVSWRNYSHLFATGHHEVLDRSRARALLLQPPDPPFLLVIAVSAKKHLLFRARVALSRDVYPVQFEDDSVLVLRAAFGSTLAVVEELLVLGFTRDEIASGRYDQNRLYRAGRFAWIQCERPLSLVRTERPDLLRLALHVAAVAQNGRKP